MKTRVVKFEYTRNKPSVKYALLCQRWDHKQTKDLVVYDITQLANKALSEDRENGHQEGKGPAFGWLIYNAINAGDAHVEVLNRWNRSKSLSDRDFVTFKKWFMRNSQRSVDVYDWTRNLLEPEYDEWYFLENAVIQSVPEVETYIDFKPKIGLDGGTWRNFKSSFVNYHRDYRLD